MSSIERNLCEHQNLLSDRDNSAELSDVTINSVANIQNIDSNQAPESSDDEQKHNQSISTKNAFANNPRLIKFGVQSLLEKWGKAIPIPPEQFLLKLLNSRGYCFNLVESLNKRLK